MLAYCRHSRCDRFFGTLGRLTPHRRTPTPFLRDCSRCCRCAGGQAHTRNGATLHDVPMRTICMHTRWLLLSIISLLLLICRRIRIRCTITRRQRHLDVCVVLSARAIDFTIDTVHAHLAVPRARAADLRPGCSCPELALHSRFDALSLLPFPMIGRRMPSIVFGVIHGRCGAHSGVLWSLV